jgi:hypothetical protein
MEDFRLKSSEAKLLLYKSLNILHIVPSGFLVCGIGLKVGSTSPKKRVPSLLRRWVRRLLRRQQRKGASLRSTKHPLFLSVCLHWLALHRWVSPLGWLALCQWVSFQSWLAHLQWVFRLRWLAPVMWIARPPWLARSEWGFRCVWLALRLWVAREKWLAL